VLPEITTPLLFRGGSSDVWNMQQVFMNRQYDVEILEPHKILNLGAYVGYTAVYFANRFPTASIISVEPPGSNFDTLVANTAAYPNIRCLPAALLRLNSSMENAKPFPRLFDPHTSAVVCAGHVPPVGGLLPRNFVCNDRNVGAREFDFHIGE
jgi:hypothetical protein